MGRSLRIQYPGLIYQRLNSVRRRYRNENKYVMKKIEIIGTDVISFKITSVPIVKNIAQSIAARKKDAVISLRINSEDFKLIKKKAQQFGIRYQTFVSELIHKVAHS